MRSLCALLVAGCLSCNADLAPTKASPARTPVIPPVAPPLGPAAWRWENPLPVGVTLRGAWAAASDDVWAAGDAGRLLHYDGHAWALVAVPTDASLNAVWGTGRTDVWVAGDAGTLLHFDGTAWARVASGTVAPLGSLSGTAADDVWASSAAIPVAPLAGTTGGAVPGAALLHFDGNAWTQVAAHGPTAVFALARDDVWVGGCDELWYFDGGSWSSFAGIDGCVRAILGLPGGPLFTVAEHGVECERHSLMKCPEDLAFQFVGGAWRGLNMSWWPAATAAGATLWWAASDGFDDDSLQRWDGSEFATVGTMPTMHEVWPLAIAATSTSDAWIVGAYGRRAHFDGHALTEPDAARTNRLWAMAGTDDCDLWAVGDEALALHRSCDGTWTTVDLTPASVPQSDGVFGENGDARRLCAVAATAPDEVWISSVAGALLHFDGARWTSEQAPTACGLLAPGRGRLYVAGIEGLFRRASDGWHQELPGRATIDAPGEMIFAVWASSPDDLWALGALGPNGSTVHHFDGTSWSVAFQTPAFMRALGGSGPDDVWIGGDGIYHFDGVDWQAADSLAAVYDLRVGCGQLWANGWDSSAGNGWGPYRYGTHGWTREPLDVEPESLFATATTLYAYGFGGAIESRRCGL